MSHDATTSSAAAPAQLSDHVDSDMDEDASAPKAPRKPREPSRTDPEKLEYIFETMNRIHLQFPVFLALAFAQGRQNIDAGRLRRHAAAVHSFLSGQHKSVKPQHVVQLMYENRDSRPHGDGAIDDERKMAKAALEDWAFDLTCDMLAREARSDRYPEGRIPAYEQA